MENDQVQRVIDFASQFVKSLQKSHDGLSEHYPDISSYIDVLPFDPTHLSKIQRSSLRDDAIYLWNLCNSIPMTAKDEQQTSIVHLRAFAWFLLNSATQSKSTQAKDKLIQSSLVTARQCLHADLAHLAQRILENDVVASNVIKIEGFDQEGVSNITEFYCLRLLLAWKQDRKDLSDYWYTQIMKLQKHLSEADVEKIVDLFRELANQCLALHDTSDAKKWFNRAVDLLNQDEFYGTDLKLATLHPYVQLLWNSNIEGDRTHAGHTLRQLRSEYGTKLPILALSLELQCKDAMTDPESIATLLRDMIRTSHIIESNHQLIMHFIHRLHERNPRLGLNCLKQYFIDRLVEEDNREWIEKTLVSHVNLFCKDQDPNSKMTMTDLEQDLDDYIKKMQDGVSACAAQAIHMLIWRMVLLCDERQEHSKAISWCHIALHSLFDRAGEAEKGKFERQVISCHIAMSNLEAARETIDGLSLGQKNHSKTRYLAYCIALRLRNHTESQSVLNTITNGQCESDQVLFACVGESIKHEKLLDTAHILQRIYHKHCQSSSPPIDLGALLQCCATVLLRWAKYDAYKDSPDLDTIRRICSVFKNALKYSEQNVKIRPKNRSNFNVEHLAQQSFEVAITHLESWPKCHLIDLLQYSIELHSLHDQSLDQTGASDVGRKTIREARYVQAILYTIEARNYDHTSNLEDLPKTAYDSRCPPKISEQRLTLYRNAFNHFSSLKKQYDTEVSSASKGEQQECLDAIQLLVPLAFEALLFMKAEDYLLNGQLKFDEMGIMQFLGVVNGLEISMATYALLSDLILTFACNDTETPSRLNDVRIPAISAARLLSTIIQTLRESRTYNIDQASRWIRCVVELIVDEIESKIAAQKLMFDTARQCDQDQNVQMLSTVIEEAINLARISIHLHDPTTDVDMTETDDAENSTYPEEELQWLAIRIFNLAVDFCAAQCVEQAKKCAAKAVEVAGLFGSGPGITGLVTVLRQKIRELDLE